MKCLITGCDLHDLAADRWAHGDLHEVGGAYVFNAVTRSTGETGTDHSVATAWGSRPRRTDGVTLVVIGLECYFERRGVIVVSRRDAVLSDAAKHHIYGDGTRHAA